MVKRKSVCILCEKERSGKPIKEDFVIKTIRGIKQKLRIATNNKLVVCSECEEAYRKKKEEFEKTLVLHATIAALIVIVFLALPFVVGRPFSFTSLFAGILLGIFIVGLTITRYIPAVEMQKK